MLEESMSTVPSIWASIFTWWTPTVLFVFLNLMIGTILITSNLGSDESGDNKEEQKQQESPHRLPTSPSLLQRLKSITFYNCRSQEPITSLEKSPHLDVDPHFACQQTPQPELKQGAFLSRSPPVLQRLKSIDFDDHLSQEPTSYFSLETREPETHYPLEQTHEQEQPQFEEEVVKEKEEEEEEREQIQEESLDDVYNERKQTHVTRTKSDTKPTSGEIPTKLPRKMWKSASTKSSFEHFEEEDIVESRRPATMREGKVSKEADDEVDAKADNFINRFRNELKLQRIDSSIRSKEMVRGGSAK